MLERRLIPIEGHEIAIVAANEHLGGPCLVFLHGVLGSVNFWGPTLPAELAHTTRWYSIGLPGHWPSRFPAHLSRDSLSQTALTALMLQAIESQIGQRPARLVGWSSGGFLALNLAANYPDRFTSLLSISGFSDGRWRGLLGTLQKWTRHGALTRQLFRQSIFSAQKSFTAFRRANGLLAFDRPAFRASRIGHEALKCTYQDFRRHERSSLSAFFNCARDFDITDQLSGIRCPATIVGGTHDPVIHFDRTQMLAAAVPGSRLVPLEGCGHAFFAERTELYHQILLAWWFEQSRVVTRSRAA